MFRYFIFTDFFNITVAVMFYSFFTCFIFINYFIVLPVFLTTSFETGKSSLKIMCDRQTIFYLNKTSGEN